MTEINDIYDDAAHYETFRSFQADVQHVYDERLEGWAEMAIDKADEIQHDYKMIDNKDVDYDDALEEAIEVMAFNMVDDVFGFVHMIPNVAHTERVDPQFFIEFAEKYAEYDSWDIDSLLTRLSLELLTEDLRVAVREQRRPRRKVATIEMDSDQDVDYDDLLDFSIEGKGQQETPFEIEHDEATGEYIVYRVLEETEE